MAKMAKKPANTVRRRAPIPAPDDQYFDDDLDVVTRDLPTEADYAPAEEATPVEAAPETRPLTRGVGRLGIRMVGLPTTPDTLDDESVMAPADDDADLADEAYADDEDVPEADAPAEDSGDAEDDDYAETVYASDYSALPEDDEAADEYLTPRERQRRKPQNAAPAPMPPKKKQYRRARPEKDEEPQNKHPKLRMFFLIMVTAVLLGCIGMMMLRRTMMAGTSWLRLPETVVSTSVGPVQNFFSGLSEYVFGYFRDLKYRANLEEQYQRVVAENEQLAIAAAFAEEYKRQLAMMEAMVEEINMGSNRELNPIICQVIGREQGNYFSTFTINQGSRAGIEPYMAVTIGGALVGYTEEVYANSATVRTIIDSGASIAGLIQSSRDQGIISGTLGIDGTAMCRMYYLPEDHLPRPGDIVVTSGIGMSFPKGIPIGTVRESTRGTDANKKYVVVEPAADFQHLEYVIVYRFKPEAEAVEGRDTTSSYTVYVPTDTARPYPTLSIGTTLKFGETPTPSAMPTITPSPTPSPTPTPTPTPSPTPRTTGPAYQYQSGLLGPTATPSPTPTPTPMPIVTIDPSQMTWEDD